MPALDTIRRTMSLHRRKSTGNVAKLQQAIHNLLNYQEQEEFREIINDYQSRRNLPDFCHSLGILLDTPAKKQINKWLRKIIRKDDVARFDELIVQTPTRKPQKSQNVGEHWDTTSLPRRLPGQYATLGRLSRSTPSIVSAPAYNYGTLPHRVTKRPMAHTDFLSNGRTSAPEWEVRSMKVKHIHLEQTSNPNKGLGFSIRGGAQHGIGIYVSYVDVGSMAERQGLSPGDQIISVNGISFKKITHNEAARIVKTCPRLDLEVRHVGRVPGSFETHQTYTWVDGMGRTVSPPPEVDQLGRYNTDDGRRSGLMLLKDSDERKVNLVVSGTVKLGLAIRGGNEFGLGIYITQVDFGSTARNAGLKVGDQILDVNGKTFLDISHADAVKVLKSSSHLMITVKDVGKLPYARTTYDQTQWISGNKLNRTQPQNRPRTTDTRSESASIMNGFAGPHASDSSMFSRGAGSQLMHNSTQPHTTQFVLVEERSRQLLSERQHSTLKYYLDEYENGTIKVQALLMALFEVLNTREKFVLMTDIRGIIHPKDIKIFDRLVRQHEENLLKTQASEEEMEALRRAIELIENDRHDGKGSRRLKNKDEMRSPSEDSGVDLNGTSQTRHNHRNKPQASRSSRQQTPSNSIGRKSAWLHGDSAYSLMDTSIPVPDSDDPDAMLSSMSDLDESLHRRLDMFKTLPAQFESEIVHANIQTDGSWRKERFLGSNAARNSRHESMSRARSMGDISMTGNNLRVLYDNSAQSLDSPHDMSSTSGILDISKQWSDTSFNSANDDDPFDIRVRKPPKPPRSHKISTKAQLHSQPTQEFPFRATNIPDISLDQSNITSSQSPNSGPNNAIRTNPWSINTRLTEPLSIIPPSSSEPRSTSSKSTPTQLKIYDIPFDESDIPFALGPPSETSLQLSPIPIVPPPPPMESPLGRDITTEQMLQLKNSSKSDARNNQQNGELVPKMMEGAESNDDSTKVVKYITVHKERPTLGVAIEGGANTRQPLPRIINIQPDGAAAMCEGLEIGDIITEVNGEPLEGLLHRQCAKTIATAFKNKHSPTLVLTVMTDNQQR